MAQFEIVEGPRPEPEKKGPPLSPASQAVIDGHTVFLAGVFDGLAGRFESVTARGFKVRTQKGERNGERGTYVWAER